MSVFSEMTGVGRGGWYTCPVCPSRHTDASKTGRSHRKAYEAVLLGPDHGMRLSAAQERIVESVFATREAIRLHGVPQAFHDAFPGDEPL